MYIRNFFAAAFLAASTICAAQQINPITQAMLNGYQEVLDQNPKDYSTLYQRAVQYYKLNMYDQALVDLGKAIQYTPEKDKEMAADEYSLLADVAIELGDYKKASEAVDRALDLRPSHYPDLYKKGNIALLLNDPESAYRSFASMQRIKSRSQEAYFGMARADIMMGKTAGAETLMKAAEEADPSNYITYCRLGELYEEMGDNGAAANNFLSAFGLADNSSRPIESLIKLAGKDYGAVASALDYAVSKSSNRVPLYFLKGNIAYNSGNYTQAYEAFNNLLNMEAGREASVYSSMARTCLALNKLNEAQTFIDQAIVKDASAANMLVKAQIENALGNGASALLNAGKAHDLDPAMTDALVEMALAQYALGESDKALASLNEAVMNNAEDPYPLIIRAYIYANGKRDQKSAVSDYMRASSLDTKTFPGFAYKALAQASAGKKIDADATMERALLLDNSKDACYYAAVYYAQTGNLDKAKAMMDKAHELGYQNLYNIENNKTANINISPIRHLN